MGDFIGAVDQGTTSTRFIVFDHDGRPVAKHQLEHEQVLPRAGWVEHNPLEIWDRTQTVIGSALGQAGIASSDLDAIGVTNQRETAIEPVQPRTDPPRGTILILHGVQDKKASMLSMGKLLASQG